AAVVEMDSVHVVAGGDIGKDIEQVLLHGRVARLKERALTGSVGNRRAVALPVTGEPVAMRVPEMLCGGRTACAAPGEIGVEPGVDFQTVGVRLFHDPLQRI